jgi:hypothetical protein
MSSAPEEDQRIQEQAREAFISSMKTRIEQAQASGQSKKQIREQTAAYARDEIHQQIPQLVSQACSWWSGFKRYLMVSVVALGLAVSLAWLVEHRHAAPLCELYAKEHRLNYGQLSYPSFGHSSTSGSATCNFFDASGHKKLISLAKLEPNLAIDLMVSLALGLGFTFPAFFLIIALISGAIERLKEK